MRDFTGRFEFFNSKRVNFEELFESDLEEDSEEEDFD